jgi:hypothetical protein
MALQMICEQGHVYTQPDLIMGELGNGEPICPECAQIWREAKAGVQGTLLERMQRLSLNPGDTLVLFTKRRLTQHERTALVHQLQGIFPDNQVMVLDDDMQIAVVEGSG